MCLSGGDRDGPVLGMFPRPFGWDAPIRVRSCLKTNKKPPPKQKKMWWSWMVALSTLPLPFTLLSKALGLSLPFSGSLFLLRCSSLLAEPENFILGERNFQV